MIKVSHRIGGMIILGLLVIGCGIISACENNPVKQVYSAPPNNPPIADFQILPVTGTTESWFVVDASASTDPDDPDDYLRYQWNWDYEPGRHGFGDLKPSPIDSHQYFIEGVHSIRLQVTDPGGNTSVCDRSVQVAGRSRWILSIGTENTYFTNKSSAAIGDDGTVYVGSGDSGLYAISPAGEIIWKVLTGGQIDASPAVSDDGSIIFGSTDSNIYAVSPDGSVKWTFKTAGEVDGSPGIGPDGTIYIASDNGFLYALDPSGQGKWVYLIGNSTRGHNQNSPAIGSDGTIYIGNRRGRFYAISPEGDLEWEYETGGYQISSPALDADGTIYAKAARFSEDDFVFALTSTGQLLWQTDIPHTQSTSTNSSPAIGLDGTLYVGGYDTHVYALNPDGTILWTYPAQRWISSSPAVGADGTVYIGTTDHGGPSTLLALNPDGSLLWEYHARGEFESSPALVSGSLYALDDAGYFYAIEIDSDGLADSPWPKYRGNARNTGYRYQDQ